jgi:hypothetical protein
MCARSQDTLPFKRMRYQAVQTVEGTFSLMPG